MAFEDTEASAVVGTLVAGVAVDGVVLVAMPAVFAVDKRTAVYARVGFFGSDAVALSLDVASGVAAVDDDVGAGAVDDECSASVANLCVDVALTAREAMFGSGG